MRDWSCFIYIQKNTSPTFCYNIQEVDKKNNLGLSLFITTIWITLLADKAIAYHYFNVSFLTGYAYLSIGYVGSMMGIGGERLGPDKDYWSGEPVSPCADKKEYLYFVIYDENNNFLENQCPLKSINANTLDQILRNRIASYFYRESSGWKHELIVDTFKKEAKLYCIWDETVVQEYNNCLFIIHLPGGNSRIKQILNSKK